MNRYGAVAEKHYRHFLPTQYALITDPTVFFNDLGDQISDQIDEMKWSLAGADPADETFMNKLGRLNMAELMAREAVLAELLPAPENEDLDAPSLT